MKVLVRSSLHSSNELGVDSFEFIRALMRSGIKVYLDPIDVEAPLPQDIAALLVQFHPLEYDLAIDYVPLEEVGMTPKLRKRAQFSIAWVYHHTNSCYKHGLRKQLKSYDLVVAQDENTFNVLDQYAEDTKQDEGINRIMQPSGYDVDNWRFIERDWFAPTLGVLVISRGEIRENVENVIQAFHQLRQENDAIRLTIKTTPDDTLNDALMLAVPELTIYKANWNKDTFKSFFGLFHIIVCADSGGFKNLHALQFMATGGVAMGTNVSMNRNWLSSAHSYSLPVTEQRNNKRETDVSVDSYDIYTAMRSALNERAKIAHKGKVASDVMPVMLGWDAVINNLFLRIAGADPAGETLRNKFLQLKPPDEDTEPWKI